MTLGSLAPVPGGTARRPAWLRPGLAALLLAVLVIGGCAGGKEHGGSQLYHCPMHPDYVSDKPGDCPICGMALVPLKAAPPKSMPATGKGDGQAPAAPRDGGTAVAAPIPPSIQVDADKAGMAGVRSVEAVAGSLAQSIRAVGTVEADETRVRHVTTKVGGWVERLYVNAVGEPVRAGQPLFELYSPELLATQEEYLRARQSADEFARSSVPEVRRGGEELAASARRRLELFDVPAEFLRELDRTGKARRTVVFRAPFSGHVTEKMVVEGHRVQAGDEMMTLSDLSRVWVAAQLYEAEAAAARVGRPATITLPYDKGRTLRGRISLVYPTIEPESRTLRVRVEFPNPGLALKPGMFVNVALEQTHVEGLIIPDSAVIDSGTRQVVFVEARPGNFQPREVHVALRAEGRAVVHGLEAGERVASSANFLLDSESRLRGSATPAPTSGGQTGKAPQGAGQHRH